MDLLRRPAGQALSPQAGVSFREKIFEDDYLSSGRPMVSAKEIVTIHCGPPPCRLPK